MGLLNNQTYKFCVTIVFVQCQTLQVQSNDEDKLNRHQMDPKQERKCKIKDFKIYQYPYDTSDMTTLPTDQIVYMHLEWLRPHGLSAQNIIIEMQQR